MCELCEAADKRDALGEELIHVINLHQDELKYGNDAVAEDCQERAKVLLEKIFQNQRHMISLHKKMKEEKMADRHKQMGVLDLLRANVKGTS